MKGQAAIIFALVFTLIIALFAVINVESVPVNFLFGTTEAPLILIILFSVLMGSLLTGFIGFVKVYKLQREIKLLKSMPKEQHKLNDEQEWNTLERKNLEE